MAPINQILCADAARALFRLQPESIPLTVTSPPYDKIRDYGWPWNFNVFKRIAEGLWRVTAPGGILAWNVQDQIVDGKESTSESCTSARQVLYFRSLGFALHETLIIMKRGRRYPPPGSRYDFPPEYVFIFAKGTPAAFHPLCDRRNITAGKPREYYRRSASGGHRPSKPVPEFGPRRLLWMYSGNYTKDRYACEHDSRMAEPVARDLIRSWSNPYAVVLDPFAGVGTTPKMAILNHRQYLGIEISPRYCEIARRRVADAERAYQARLAEVFRLHAG